jgi:hypothetical protein
MTTDISPARRLYRDPHALAERGEIEDRDGCWEMSDVAETIHAAPPKPSKRGSYRKRIATWLV